MAIAIAAVLGAGPASAVLYDEYSGSDPQLGNTFAARTTLDPSVDQVRTEARSDDDFFVFSGLTAGHNFTMTVDCEAGDGVAMCGIDWLSDAQVSLYSQVIASGTQDVFNGVVPGSGVLNISHRFLSAEFNVALFTLETSAPPQVGVPLADTGALLGIGAATAGLTRRRRKRVLPNT
ncbi:MAG: hypothetical protein KDG50_02465 [Chromatiales bacterium]|nr:hypothetical protein [Chromatiales bacterium]